MNVRYIFFGTPEFAETVLKKLISDGFPPAIVVCNPDKPAGRKKTITAPPVKQRITHSAWRTEILQPENVKTISNKLHAISPDFAIVAAYGKIIPKEILAIPRLGTIGVHPSLLPKHRGPSPIQSAILAGDEEMGVTLYLMDEKVDHGPIIAKSKIENQKSKLNYAELQSALAKLGGELLVETLPQFLKGGISPQLQNESEATYTKKISTEDARVEAPDLNKARAGENLELANDIERKIRALNPEPGVWTMQEKKRVKLLTARVENGKLILETIQEEGKKPRTATNGEKI